MSRTIIALCGPQGSGKTTAAKLLVEHHGFERTRFADSLKAMVRMLLIYQDVPAPDIYRMLDGDLKEIPTEFLNYRTPRHAMQMLGTEWRDLIHRSLWVDVWERSIVRKEKIVVDDMRFLHEAQRIKFLNGTIIGVTRPGCGPGEHVSEREYLKITPDFSIMNDREPEDILRQIQHCLGTEP